MAYTNQYDNIFQSIGSQYNLDPNLLKTIAIKESGINPNIADNKNPNGTKDVGLMQINSSDPEYQQYGYQALKTNPWISVEAAAQTLQDKQKLASTLGLNPNDPFNLLWLYNGYSDQGKAYATDAMGIYQSLGGGGNVGTISGGSGSAPSSSTSNGGGAVSGWTIYQDPTRIFWLLIGIVVIGLGLYVMLNPLANLSNVVEGLTKK